MFPNVSLSLPSCTRSEKLWSPFDVYHNPKELGELVTLLKTLDGDTKVVMEYTDNYYLPIALFLRNNGLFVSVVTPILVKDYSTKSLTVHKVKTDKKIFFNCVPVLAFFGVQKSMGGSGAGTRHRGGN